MNIMSEQGTTDYKGFFIIEHKGSSKRSFRIYQNGAYMQTSNTLKKAKQTIDFNLKNGVWEDK